MAGALLLLVLLATVNSSQSASYQRRSRSQRVESITTCFLAEYANWRKLEQVVIFVHPSSGIMDIVRGLNRRGVFVGLQSMTDPQLPSAVHILRHRLGAVIMLGPQVSTVAEEFLEQVSQKQLFHAYVSWLIITEKSSGVVDSNSTIEDRLRYFNIGPDTDLVVATIVNVTKEDDKQNDSRHRTHHKQDESNNNNNGSVHNVGKRNVPSVDRSYGEQGSYSETSRDDKKRTEDQSQKSKTNTRNKYYRSTYKEIGNCRENSHRAEYAGLQFSLLQAYKIRPTSNSSLVLVPLGSWNPIIGIANLVLPSSIEQRNDFRGLPLFVGIKNASQNAADGGGGVVKDASPTSQSTDDDMDEDHHLMDVLDFIARSLNASYELVPFTKLGWKNEEGAWLFMLGAVTMGTVDLGLDNVVITPDRSREMFFTLPIVQSMKNIYFRRPESSAMRDIFLAPFSPRLLASVAATGVVIATAMVLVNACTAKKEKKRKFDFNNKNSKTKWSLGEAMVWSVSVLCMQGSSWSPKTPSGCMVLIFSLCFALVIYNAYAAFITSVLSVRVASIRGLGDLLDSDFQFGYTLQGQDEAFLRTVNDTTLRRLYFRGLVRNHGVREASAGLLKASSGGYAFFVSARLARKALNSFIAQDKRCAIQELTVETTKSAIALPMGVSSPYRRLINLSLLRMREAGVLGPIQERMLPPMPRCKAYSAFNSASLTDVYSAFLVLGGGLAAAICMGLSEKIWKRRASLGRWLAAKWAGKDRNEILCDQPRIYPQRQVYKRSQFPHDIQWLD